MCLSLSTSSSSKLLNNPNRVVSRKKILTNKSTQILMILFGSFDDHPLVLKSSVDLEYRQVLLKITAKINVRYKEYLRI